ncbi:C-type lectin BiL-like [Protobothrops mucrosquamatus]|uniref:C-type lectin BiL-like n=1 Tax=Protobothrops mucrosquamatus TaxID=103944 RepID=UPI0007756AD7|nr:C-type lectin BiL-like [Protobothrops mucrosquamatus]
MGRFICLSFGLLVVGVSLRGAKGSWCPSDWLAREGFCYKLFNIFKNWKYSEVRSACVCLRVS